MDNIQNDYQSALHVNDGIPQPAQVNPYLKKKTTEKGAATHNFGICGWHPCP